MAEKPSAERCDFGEADDFKSINPDIRKNAFWANLPIAGMIELKRLNSMLDKKGFTIERYSKPWRLLGIGFYHAWIYLAVLSPAFYAQSAAYVSNPFGISVLVSGFLVFSMLVAIVGNACIGFLEKPLLIIPACLMAGIGTLIMAFSQHDSLVVLGVGIILADAGTTVLILFWGKLWTTINTERMSTHLVLSNILACFLYFVIMSLPSSLMLPAIALLPIASGIILFFSRDEPLRERARSGYTIPPSIWKLIAALIIIPLAYSLVRSFFAQGSLGLFGASYLKVMHAFALFSTVTAVVVLMAKNYRTIVKLYRFSVPLFLLGVISLMSLPSDFQWVSFGAIMVGYSMFGELIWLMHPSIEVVIGDRKYLLFGWGRLLFHASALAGSLFGMWLLSQVWFSDIALTIACLALTLLTVLLSTNILTGQDFQSFISPIRVEMARTRSESRAAFAEITLEESCEKVACDYGLSKREAEVLLFLARGRSLPYIEEQLFVSNSTARTHTRNIYRKIGVHTKQELINVVEEQSLEAPQG